MLRKSKNLPRTKPRIQEPAEDKAEKKIRTNAFRKTQISKLSSSKLPSLSQPSLLQKLWAAVLPPGGLQREPASLRATRRVKPQGQLTASWPGLPNCLIAKRGSAHSAPAHGCSPSLGVFLVPKLRQDGLDVSWSVPGRCHDGLNCSKRPPRRSKTPPRRPQVSPAGLQDAPRCAQDSPRGLQDMIWGDFWGKNEGKLTQKSHSEAISC